MARTRGRYDGLCLVRHGRRHLGRASVRLVADSSDAIGWSGRIRGIDLRAHLGHRLVIELPDGRAGSCVVSATSDDGASVLAVGPAPFALVVGEDLVPASAERAGPSG